MESVVNGDWQAFYLSPTSITPSILAGAQRPSLHARWQSGVRNDVDFLLKGVLHLFELPGC